MDEPKPMRELTRIREERGLSQQGLADASGVNKATINQIERGRRSPNLETLEKLAGALAVEIADFFPKAQAPLPLDGQAGMADGVIDPVAAAETVKALKSNSEGLAAVWNQDVELYERHGRDLQPYRTLEMSSAVVVLYQQFWGALEALQRHAQQLGLDPDVRTWEPQSKQLLLESGSSIRALAELYEVINRSSAEPGIDSGNFRAMREEFDAGGLAGLADDPRWPEAFEKARVAVGLA